jgi:hypothetical protein
VTDSRLLRGDSILKFCANAEKKETIMKETLRIGLCSIALGAWAASSLAQTMPTSQPDVVGIQIEEIKVGHGEDHRITESLWPAALARAKSAFPDIALSSMSGKPEVWFVAPFESHAKVAESMEEGGQALADELSRIAKVDSEHLSGFRSLHLAARKDLSHGPFPETAKQRFYEITTFQLRPGGEAAFEAAAKAYGAAAGRAAPGVSYRVYQVMAGMSSPTYLVFSSTTSFAEFDKMLADGMATMKAMTPQEQEAIQKSDAQSITIETNRYRLDPDMSYVPQSVRDQDPKFWKKSTTSP